MTKTNMHSRLLFKWELALSPAEKTLRNLFHEIIEQLKQYLAEKDTTESLHMTAETNDHNGELADWLFLRDANLFAGRHQEHDKNIPGRFFVTDVCAAMDKNSITMGVKHTMKENMNQTGVAPIIVPELPNILAALCVGNQTNMNISDKPIGLNGNTELEAFWRNQEHTLPTLALSKPNRGSFVIEPAVAAKQLFCLANVVVLPPHEQYPSIEIFNGMNFSDFGKNVRLYFQPLTHELKPPLTNLLHRNPEVACWHSDQTNEDKILLNKIRSFCVLRTLGAPLRLHHKFYNQLNSEERLKLSRQAKTVSFETNRDIFSRKPKHDKTIDVLKVLKSRLAVEQSKIDELWQLAAENEDELRAEIEYLKSENHELACKIQKANQDKLRFEVVTRAILQSQKTKNREEIVSPSNYAELISFCERHYKDRLTIHKRAQGILLKDPDYKNVGFLWDCIQFLAVQYWELRALADDVSYTQYHDAMNNLHVEVGPSLTPQELAARSDEYSVSYEGSKRFLDLHLKKGKTRNKEFCLRIYFFWDEFKQHVVIGSMPYHLTTSAS